MMSFRIPPGYAATITYGTERLILIPVEIESLRTALTAELTKAKAAAEAEERRADAELSEDIAECEIANAKHLNWRNLPWWKRRLVPEPVTLGLHCAVQHPHWANESERLDRILKTLPDSGICYISAEEASRVGLGAKAKETNP